MVEIAHAGYTISDDKSRLDIDLVHRWLSEDSYWAAGRPRAVMERSIAHALCFGAYAPDGAQAGFAKVVTDYAISASLNDVFVLPAHRGHGLGEALVRAALAHPSLTWVRRWNLRTRDAHGLYARFGFVPVQDTETMMTRWTEQVDFSVPPVDAPAKHA
jgi:GNAT superfamily N-acetyltransferase